MVLIDLEEGTKAQRKLLLQQSVKTLIYEKKNLEALQIIADHIIKENNIKTIRDDKNEEMYIYKEGIYLPNAKSYIKELSEEILGTQYTKQKANNIIEKIVAVTYIDMDEFFNQQTINKFLIPVNNGILNLIEKKLLSFSPDYYFFNKLSIDYNPDIKSDKIIKFINQITKTENDVKVIQELFGFCLVKEYTIEKAVMLYGEHGRNGKSKLLDILTYFVGVDNTSSIDLQDFNDDSFAVSNLRNKLVNIGSDIGNDNITSTNIFKKLTGRDVVQANRKNLSRIQFVNYAKMIFAANELPPINTNSDAFWERWVIIEFPYRFLPKKEIESLPLNKREGVFLQDPSIIDGLITPDELTGLLNWSLVGLTRLFSNKDFSNKETTKDIRISWLRKSNSVSAFIIDCVDEDYDSFIPKTEFKRYYLAYCRDNNIRPLSDKVIKRTLENDVGAATSRRTSFIEGIGNDLTYVWEGIKLKDVNVNFSPVSEGVVTKLLHSEEFVND
jgi:putative DNA primase/helicase